jgi:hypothetical protein
MADVPQAAAEPKAAPAAAADPAAEPKAQPETRTYSQEEVDRIVGKVRKNTARDTELKFRRETEPRQAPEPKQEPKQDAEPQRGDFDTHEEFDLAHKKFVARTVAREELANRDKEVEQKTQREAQVKAEQSWHGRIQVAMEKHQDFETKLEMNDDTVELIHKSRMREAIVESEIGPEIVYELCSNPAEAKRIAALPGYKQAAEIAKIEERLTAAAPKADPKDPADEDDKGDPDEKGDPKADPTRNADGTFKAKKEPSKAPPPISPVGGGAAAASTGPSDKDSPEVWRSKRTAELERRRQGK